MRFRASACATFAALLSWTCVTAAADEPSRLQRWTAWIPDDIAVRLTQGGLESKGPEDLGGGLLGLDVRLGASLVRRSPTGQSTASVHDSRR